MGNFHYVQKPALPKMPGQCTRSLARSAGQRTAAHPLRPRGLHVAAAPFTPRAAEQTRDLCLVIPGQRRDAAGGRPRSEAPRRRDRILQRPSHLEPEMCVSSAKWPVGSTARWWPWAKRGGHHSISYRITPPPAGPRVYYACDQNC